MSTPQSTSPSFTLIIVDDHFVVRTGLAAAFELEADIRVLGVASSGAEALVLYERQGADVVLLDLQLPDMSGLAVLEWLRATGPAVRILVYSAYVRDDEVREVLDRGASGYVQKTASREELLLALRRVAAGGRYVPPEVYRRIQELKRGPVITEREREILALVSRGQGNKEIAATLGISTETVKEHISSILDKLNVRDRTQATTEAIRRGILTLSG